MNPHKKEEVWRFLTYMFVHSGFFHITFNVLIQASSAIYYYKSNKQLTFYHLLRPLWPSMIKCLLSRPGLIAGPLHSTPLQINSQSNPRLDPIDSKSSFTVLNVIFSKGGGVGWRLDMLKKLSFFFNAILKICVWFWKRSKVWVFDHNINER